MKSIKIRKLKLFAILFVLFCSSSCFAQGFVLGDHFTNVPIQGDLQLECMEGQVSFYGCTDTLLEPSDYDYFQSANLNADEVDLVAVHENGKSVKQHSGIKNGKSTDSFNLSVNSLFQTALLDMGVNKIKYILKLKGQQIETGTFIVTVSQGVTLTCAEGFISTFNDSFCNSPNLACNEYFSENNYCK